MSVPGGNAYAMLRITIAHVYDMSYSVLITGAAGFIGSHVTERLLSAGCKVIGIDNFDSFYSQDAKRRNIAGYLGHPSYTFEEVDIRDGLRLQDVVPDNVGAVIHMAARAGVRPSIENPLLYQDVNVYGTQNVLELCRVKGIKRCVFASSSSVYGVNPNHPWSEDCGTLLPISPYASTKVSGELLGHVYSHLYGIRFIALRLFTVYGPRQRPDLAIHNFARRMLNGSQIQLFSNSEFGQPTYRDYTYVDDAVSAIIAALSYNGSMYEVINVGSDSPVKLIDMVRLLEKVLSTKAEIEWLPAQPGDVSRTWADISKARGMLGYSPATNIVTGLEKFASWLATSQSYTS